MRQVLHSMSSRSSVVFHAKEGSFFQASIVPLALVYRLLGTVLYLRLGHLAGEMFLALRAVFVVVYASAIGLAPAFSHPVLVTDVVRGGVLEPLLPGWSAPLSFIAGHVLAAAALLAVLYHQLVRYRSQADG